ncbi:MAG: penicillin-binding protein 1A [Betaproteobacteria bacterium]
MPLSARTIDFRIRELIRQTRDAARRYPRATTGIAAGLALAACLFLGAAAWFLVSLGRGLPDERAIRQIGEMDQATAIFDDADQLAFTLYKEQRIEVPLAKMSPYLLQAIVAIEDQRFYQHHGFDLVRMASAALTNLRYGRAAQGGSTITQQLARQSFLTPDKTLHRKLQELILARRIERMYSKQQILELYLNKVYFGDGLYGVEAASRGYFGKHAADLTLPEAALLAGLVQSPSSYAPTVSPDRAVARRNVVLQAMLDSGAIDRAAWQHARATKLALHDSLRADEPHGLYFKEEVRQELVQHFGWQRVYQGGLRVYSTIDMPMQAAAERILRTSLDAIDARREQIAARRHRQAGKGAADGGGETAPEPRLQGALMALDPVTGHVLAMIGGRDFDESHFNRAVQARRQPGSAFKPFVYAAALEHGYTPATVIDHLNDPVPTLQGNWTPEDEHLDSDFLTMRTALRTSSNRAAVRLLQDIGIGQAVRCAKDMGVGDVPSVPSLALGSGEVTLESMTAAYAAFANHGLVPRPELIRRVEDLEGHVLYQSHDTSTRAISDTTAFLMSSMLADVVNSGTAYRARSFGFTLPAAGKTGTTNDFDDAWFVGYTPKLVTGVWVGFDQPQTILPNGFAADIAVPIWAQFMKIATKGDRAEWLDPPATVTTAQVCRLSGKLATEGCGHVQVVNRDGQLETRSMIYTEYFARGTEPTAYCDLHPTRGIFGKIADLFGNGTKPPPPHVEDAGAPAPGAAQAARQADPEANAPRAEEPKKKRGFWSRLFGFGRKHDDKKKDKKPGG